jgi:hypothetical protein
MQQPHFLLKLAAVVSSVLLAGGYVCYRAGAFDGLLGSTPTIGGVTPGSATSQQTAPVTTQPAPTIMYSTKSALLSGRTGTSDLTKTGIPVPPPAPPRQPAAEPKQSGPQIQVIMSGSKTLFLPTQVPPLPNSSGVQPPPAPPQSPYSTRQQKPMLLPGPKAGLIR